MDVILTVSYCNSRNSSVKKTKLENIAVPKRGEQDWFRMVY